ncbi:MAG: DUF1214 domain-containing protein [Hyphomicrobiaceae bacterium]
MTKRINVPTRLAAIRRTVQSAFSLIVKVTVFLVIAVGGGVASSWYAIEAGAPFNTEKRGPWVRWTGAGRPDADPYSRTRFARRAQLLFNADLTARYEAEVDDQGRRLHSSCDYIIEGQKLETPWWAIAVFNSAGRIIPNSAKRYGFNSSTIAYGPNGSFTIRLSRDARPYNWIPTTRAGSLVVVFDAQKRSGQTDVLDRDQLVLPTIKRVSC